MNLALGSVFVAVSTALGAPGTLSPSSVRVLEASGVASAPALSLGRAVTENPRGLYGEQVSLTDSFDCLPDGLSVHLQQGCPIWSNPAIVSSNLLRGTTVPSRTTVATGASVPGGGPDANGVWNVGGRKIELGASQPVAPGAFLFGMRYEFLVGVQDYHVSLEPAPGVPARLEHDVYVDSLATLWTSEARSRDAASIATRAMWGGTCAGDCDTLGLPSGPLEHLYVLGWNGFTFSFFVATWLDSAPAGANIGDPVVMPVGSWVRLRHESTTSPFRVKLYIDINDGGGMRLISEQFLLTNPGISGFLANGSFETTGRMYIDNLFASGEYTTPNFVPPPALECGPTGFLEDMQWLAGLSNLDGAGEVWATSAPINIVLAGGDISLRYNNPPAGDGGHREVMSRRLPTAYPIGGEPWVMCVDSRLSTGTFSARALAPASEIDAAITARVSQGLFNPFAALPYLSRILVQHNPAYDPIDDDDTPNAFEPGPGGNGGLPVVGGAATIGQPGFDYYDTGVSLTINANRMLCVGVSPDGTLVGSYNGVDYVGGTTGVVIDAFASSIDHIRFEAEAGVGNNSTWLIDDLSLSCIDLPLVSLPALTLPYHDELDWGIEGVTIRAFDDDGFPSTPFRWTSAARTPFVASGSGLAVSSENYLADTGQGPGAPVLHVKAATGLPTVDDESSGGYAVGADALLTDFQTSRGWAVEGPSGTHAALAFSGSTGTFWSFGADGALRGGAWADTGVSPGALGIGANQWFSVRIVRQPDARFTFRINGGTLLDDGGALVRVASASGSTEPGRLLILGGDDLGAAAGSTLVFDNIRAWALPCAGDTNDDGQVTFADINAILGAFGQTVGLYDARDIAPDADGDGFGDDGVVNFADLNAALGGFNNPCD